MGRNKDLFSEGFKAFAARQEAWVKTTLDAQSPKSLYHMQVDLNSLQQRCEVPDVPEGNLGEVASPHGGNADTEKCGSDDIAESFPQVETFVGALPDALKTVGVIRLS